MTMKFLPYAFLLLLLPAVTFGEPKDLALPDFGDMSGTLISPQKEKELGENFMFQVRNMPDLLEDEEITQYVQSLGSELASHSDSPDQAFTFFVIKNPMINAFAVPGGFIGVHSALLVAADSEGEFAAVLAHEIAHISQKHLARAIYAASQQSVPKTAALLASILLGIANPQLGQAAIMATAAGDIQGQINFTRENEQEADRVGMQTLYRGQFNPNAMPDFFEKLAKDTRLYGDSVPDFLRTHPVTTARIADSKGRAAQLLVPKPKDQQDFYLIRGKILAYSSRNPNDAIAAFKSQIKDKSAANEKAALYGLAHAYLLAKQPELAKPIFEQLLREDKFRIGFINGLATAERQLNQYDSAERQYMGGLKVAPENPLLTVGLAETYLDQSKASQAKPLLQARLRASPTGIHLYDLLIRTAEIQGDLMDAHYYNAEKAYLLGQLELAIDHLKEARKIPQTDFVRQSRVDARLTQLEKLLEEKETRR